MKNFEVKKKDKNTNARIGILSTSHGAIETPSYVVVGTHAEVRCLTPDDIRGTKTQMVISNTYHLWRTLGDALSSFEGLHKRLKWDGVIMTDSGGFQVFSLGFARSHGVGKIGSIFPDEERNLNPKKIQQNLVRITNEGAWFRENIESPEVFLGPKESIQIQEQLGADIILAFDECTSPKHDRKYTEEALRRTHSWALECINAKTRGDQMLYGIVQGGAFEVLRKESAITINSMPFQGFAIGGSLGNSRREMLQVIDWVISYLSPGRPRHLLGIGRIEDLFEGVERGIDTFDCVIPTREARHGGIWTQSGRFDIKKGKWANDDSSIEEGCKCSVCISGVTRKQLYNLFKEKNVNAARFATIHNVYFFNHLMEQIREAIRNDSFSEFKKEILNRQS